MKDFNEDLFACFSDCGVCMTASFIPGGICCLQASAVKAATGDSELEAYAVVYCLVCIGGALNRKRIRKGKKIKGAFADDLCIWLFCGPCAACQEYKEFRKTDLSLIWKGAAEWFCDSFCANLLSSVMLSL